MHNHVFSRTIFVNAMKQPTNTSPSRGSATSSIDHFWHTTNSPRSRYVVSEITWLPEGVISTRRRTDVRLSGVFHAKD